MPRARAPAVRVVGSATSIPDTTVTTLDWGGTTSYETVTSMYNEAVGQQFVAPVGGIYLAHASVGFNPNATGVRTVGIAIAGNNSNPACFDRDSAATTDSTFVNVTCVINLSAGQFVTTTVTQTSGGALLLSGVETASLTWIAPLPYEVTPKPPQPTHAGRARARPAWCGVRTRASRLS